MVHTLQTMIWLSLVLAAVGAGQLFAVVGFVELVQRKPHG
jgi:hypothetical protein